MAGAYTGENGADAALNKMIKHMDRNANHGPRKLETILSQLQEQYPETWEDELAEMRREYNLPGYLAAKTLARQRFSFAFNAQPRYLISGAEQNERQFVKMMITRWIDDNQEID